MGEPPSGGSKTILVLGAARGGTSLCSQVLHELGIFTGRASRPPVYEDLELSRHLEARDFDEARELVGHYNLHHEVWAYKRPTILPLLDELHAMLRSPIYVVIFRDLLAIANRNRLSTGIELEDAFFQGQSSYDTITRFLFTNRPKALLISYEKALSNPGMLVDRLVEYLNLPATPDNQKILRAKQTIGPSPPEYVDNTSAVGFYGHLDAAGKESVSGWAACERSEQSVILTLYINGTPVSDFEANLYREDVLRHRLHATGHCGFLERYPANILPDRGDLVSVRISETDQELAGSPLRL